MSWKNLKYWQVTGIIFGSIHLILWFIFIMPIKKEIGESIDVIIFSIIESPNLAILMFLDWFGVRISVYTLAGKLFYLICGTAIYSLVGAIPGFILGLLSDMLKAKSTEVEKWERGKI